MIMTAPVGVRNVSSSRTSRKPASLISTGSNPSALGWVSWTPLELLDRQAEQQPHEAAALFPYSPRQTGSSRPARAPAGPRVADVPFPQARPDEGRGRSRPGRQSQSSIAEAAKANSKLRRWNNLRGLRSGNSRRCLVGVETKIADVLAMASDRQRKISAPWRPISRMTSPSPSAIWRTRRSRHTRSRAVTATPKLAKRRQEVISCRWRGDLLRFGSAWPSPFDALACRRIAAAIAGLDETLKGKQARQS